MRVRAAVNKGSAGAAGGGGGGGGAEQMQSPGKRWAMCPGWPKGDPKEEGQSQGRGQAKKSPGHRVAKGSGTGACSLGDLTPQDEDQEEGRRAGR